MPVTIESLISSMKWAADTQLSTYGYEDGGCRVRLVRGGGAGPAPVVAAVPEAKPEPEQAAGGVMAPMTGVCYLAPDSASAPFVCEGDAIKRGQTVCLIEAMKVMTAVVAECDGTVDAICVEDGASVEAGAVLMTVQP